MSRSGSGVYSLPANTAAVSGDTISSTKWNSLTQDIEADLNVDRPISAGGTSASTGLAALTNLFSAAGPGGADKIGFWDQSASSFAFLSLGTGLTFNGTSLDLDADLSTLAGLTVAANAFIVGNAGGTAWEVKTPSQARTSLGATTIGDTIFTAADAPAVLTATGALAASAYTAADVLAKLLTVDGAGSGLDADTVDGVNASAFALLAGAAFTGASSMENNIAFSVKETGGTARSAVKMDTSNNMEFGNANVNAEYLCTQHLFGVAGDANAALLDNTGWRARTAAGTETTGTLTSASANKTILLTGDPTINNSVFSAGDIILMYAGASARTITAGTITTMRLDATATTGSRTLAARGTAMLFFVSSSEVVVSGKGVT